MYSMFPYAGAVMTAVVATGAATRPDIIGAEGTFPYAGASVMYSTFPYAGAVTTAVVATGAATRPDIIGAEGRKAWPRSIGASMSLPAANNSLMSTTRSS